jgi:hypothetical protein
MSEYQKTEPSRTTASQDNDSLHGRLAKLEKKIAMLLGIAWLQTTLLLAWLLAFLLPKFLVSVQIVLLAAASIAGLYFFRAQIPGWLGSIARSLLSFLSSAEKKI